jgi:hypothetical protein
MHKSRGACRGPSTRADTIEHACLCRKQLTHEDGNKGHFPCRKYLPLLSRVLAYMSAFLTNVSYS